MTRRAELFGWLALALASVPATVLRAEVLLDTAPIETSRAHLLPDHADPTRFHYIPKSPRIATWPDGRPKFTLLQYARTGKEISGGLLHFLVTYGLSDEERREAEIELREKVPQGRIEGPVPFVEGEFFIISSVAGPNSEFSRRFVGSGKAPLLAGQEAAVSIALTEEGSTLLMESFEKPTSDVSVQFVLTYEGLTAPFSARLKVDWDKVYEHESFRGSVGIPFFSGKVEEVFDELREEGAIELEVTGSDEGMEALLASAYTTLTQMMFVARPVPAGDLGKVRAAGPGWKEKIFGGASLGHYMRETRYSGEYRLDMTRRQRGRRVVPITGNLGDVHRRFGNDREVFGFVDLDDPAFEERTIQVILDNEDLDSFADFVNFAGVEFRRRHDARRAITQGSTVFDRAAFAEGGNKLLFKYRRKGDRSPGWLEYELREIWSFRGGVEIEGDWRAADSDVVTLSPPYRYRHLEVLGDAANFEAAGILRAAVVFRHRYFGVERTAEVVLRSGEPLNALHSYLTEPNDLAYEYRLTFLRSGGDKIETDWRTETDPFVYAYAPVDGDATGGRR